MRLKALVHSIFQIIDIPKKTFPKLYELHTIDFSHNNITQIDRSVFVNLLSLRQLNFRHNHLEVIESSTFGKLPTLLSLDFSYNRLKRVKRGAFGGLASLRSINLGNVINFRFLEYNCVKKNLADLENSPILNFPALLKGSLMKNSALPCFDYILRGKIQNLSIFWGTPFFLIVIVL